MLSKSYKEVLSHSTSIYRSIGTQATRAFTASQLKTSTAILNKQLHYLHSQKVPSSLKASDDFIPRHLGNDSKAT